MTDPATLGRVVRFAEKTQAALNAPVKIEECRHFLRTPYPDFFLPVEVWTQMEAAIAPTQPPPTATTAAAGAGVMPPNMVPQQQQQAMCQALDPTTGQQCRQKPVPGAMYCPQHKML
jgi:hypothetical protein